MTGKKRGKGAAGKRLGAALTRLAERDGGKGGVDDEDDLEGEQDAVEDNVPASIGKRTRKTGSSAASVAGNDEDDEDEDDEYEEPKKKKTKRTRKTKASV